MRLKFSWRFVLRALATVAAVLAAIAAVIMFLIAVLAVGLLNPPGPDSTQPHTPPPSETQPQ